MFHTWETSPPQPLDNSKISARLTPTNTEVTERKRLVEVMPEDAPPVMEEDIFFKAQYLLHGHHTLKPLLAEVKRQRLAQGT